jgi:hypothetical protein
MQVLFTMIFLVPRDREYFDDVLLGLGAVRPGWQKPTFQRSVLSPFSGLK